MTTSSPFSADRPRETRSASIDRTTVLFSVAPSHSPTGSLPPSAVIARATITHRPAMCSPSSISTVMSCSDRSRDSSSASAVSVSFTSRRETADRPVERAPSSTSVPSGSAIRACRRGAAPPRQPARPPPPPAGAHTPPTPPPERGDTHRQQPLPDHAGYIGQRETDLLRQAADAHGLVLSHDLHIARYGLHSGPLFWSGRLGGRPTPTARQASGGGPPPQVPRRPGQPRLLGTTSWLARRQLWDGCLRDGHDLTGPLPRLGRATKARLVDGTLTT